MKFNEINTIQYEFLPNIFVYFLLQDEEVVYVGQTQNGIVRPLSHRDKKYNKIELLFCEENELDVLEDEMIIKYRPKYNRTLNTALSYSLLRVRKQVRNIKGFERYTIWDMKKDFKKLDIKTFKSFINNKDYIYISDVKKLLDFKERQLHE